MTEPVPAPSAIVYQERHSALRWPLLACGLGAPVAGVMVGLLFAVAVNRQWIIAAVALPFFAPFAISIGLLYRNWPTGIRIDRSTVTIGAIGSSRAVRRTPTVSHQAWAVFTCPLANVRSARVVTDPREIRLLKKSPQYYTLTNRWGGRLAMTHCRLGVLSAPFMRAALVLDFDAAEGTEPKVRPARYYTNGKGGRMSVVIKPAPGHTWVVPTRHPERLRRALAIGGLAVGT